jgi:cytochrome P450
MTTSLRTGRVPRPPGPQLNAVEILRVMRSRRPTDLLEKVSASSPTLGHFRLGAEHAYLLGTPELVRELFGPLGRVTQKGRGLEQARRILGTGLLTAEGDLHKRQRRLMQPAFHDREIAGYAEVMVTAAAELGDRWADGETRDLSVDMAELTLKIVGHALFDTDLTAESARVSGSLATFLAGAQRTMLPGGALLNRLPLPSGRRLAAADERMNALVYRLIEEHRREGDRGDVLSMLLAARDEDGSAMPDRQIRDEVLTLLLAGHETTANALAWTWYLLDRNPAAAGALHAEVDALGADPSYATMARLPYTRAAVAESMRLYPPAWVIGRRLMADTEIAGWRVPARSICVASPWVTHRDPRWWTDPTEYRPERWIAPDGRYDDAAPGQPRGAYFPFGGGRRICIGESFAWTEAVLVLATLARRWAPALVPGHPIDIRPAITLRPAYGMRMIMTAR